MSKILILLNIVENTSPTNRLPLLVGMMDNRDLSKLESGQPFRYPLAFFVPKFWKASQATQDKDTTHLTQFTGLNRHIMPALAKSYGEVILQNKTAFMANMRSGFFRAESEPCHPLLVVNNLTQKSKGGYHA